MKPNNNIDLNEPNHPLLKALYLEKPNSFKKITDLSKEKLKIYRKCTSYKKKLVLKNKQKNKFSFLILII